MNESKAISISKMPNKVIDTDNLSPEQKCAYDKFTQGENLFITGPGGTGKTCLVKYLIEHAKTAETNIQVCAMTGCAAVLLQCNARTLHSWSGIKLAKGPKDKIIDSVLRNKRIMKVWRSVKCLILDEISMLSKKIFELIEEIARLARKSSAVFGGLQVIFIGDFYQLPPIGNSGETDSEKFCFESPIWYNVFKMSNHIELKKIFRQNDPVYIDILMKIRKGHLDEDSIKLLQTYVNREYDSSKHNGCVPTKLFALRAKADFVNSQMFSKIQEQELISEVIYKNDCKTYLESGKIISLALLDNCDKLSMSEKEYEMENLVNSTPCMKLLRLKKGAVVMCTVNLDMDNSICNGSQGVVIDIINEKTPIPVVKFSNGIIKRISPHYWQSEEYPMFAVGQYPLCLAWALTIHKIQGATLGLAEMDIGQTIFEYGQTYVALSRIQSLDGLYLSAFNPQKIMANPIVNQFYEKIPKELFMDKPVIKNAEYKETTTKIIKI
jgi:ATP-dependent DNA helicase PIF1